MAVLTFFSILFLKDLLESEYYFRFIWEHIGENLFLEKKRILIKEIVKIMGCPIFAKLPTPLVLFCPILHDPLTPPKIVHSLNYQNNFEHCKLNNPIDTIKYGAYLRNRLVTKNANF